MPLARGLFPHHDVFLILPTLKQIFEEDFGFDFEVSTEPYSVGKVIQHCQYFRALQMGVILLRVRRAMTLLCAATELDPQKTETQA